MKRAGEVEIIGETKRSKSESKNFFHLSRVRSLGTSSNANKGPSLSSLIDDSNINFMVQFNFLIDIEWFTSLISLPQRKTVPILIIHGETNEGKIRIESQSQNFSNIQIVSPSMPIPYGTHHTKMMLLFYNDDSMKLIIHTANLIQRDWTDKCQGLFISPLLFKKKAGQIASVFEKDIVQYFRAYKNVQIAKMVLRLQSFDFSPIKAVFIGSVPGRFLGDEMNKWGHLKLASVFKSKNFETKEKSSVICQFSSVGSLGPKDVWLQQEFGKSLCNSQIPKPDLKLIFPTIENVRSSFEGYIGGVSLPFDEKNHLKQKSYMYPLLHIWKSDQKMRTRALPHIKTYTSITESGKINWFLLTSMNLSKAAWGSLEKNGSQLMIRSFEAGVLVFNENSELNQDILPYDFPLTPYSSTDVCWTGNRTHQQPDIFGLTWP